MPYKICPICITEFKYHRKSQVCCSLTCSNKLRYKTRPVRKTCTEWKCSKCKIVKQRKEFLERSNGDIRSRCKSCESEDRKQSYKYVPKILSEEERDYNRKREKEVYTPKKYGIRYEDILNMLIQQNYLCKICKKINISEKYNIDHCHKTGKVRGLLCSSCNSGLGKFKDNKEILLRGVEYLRKSCE
jgi:hypothetical protein